MRTFLLYLVLVGGPVLGVLGILHLGRQLTPPPFVGGAWRLEPTDAAGVSCLPLIFADDPALHLTQSGVRLQARLNDEARTSFKARLRGDSLFGQFSPASDISPCGERPVLLEAHVAREAMHLAGRLGVPGCTACPPVPFRATRLPDRTD